MSWVEIVSAILGLSCVFLAGRGSKYNFWVGYIYNVFLFVLFWRQHLYSAMLLQPVAFGINLYGHWRWTHPKEEEKNSKGDLKIGKMKPWQWVNMFTLVVLCGILWAKALQWLPQRWPVVFAPDPQPLLDSFILMLTLTAQFLSARKYWECWIVWLVVNVANIVLYISSGLYVMPIVSALYLANGRPQSGKMFTEKFGTHQCTLAIREGFMRQTRRELNDYLIDEVLRTGSADIPQEDLDIITRIAEEYVADIFRRLREHGYDQNTMKLYVCGGGGCLLKHFRNINQSKVTFVEDICAAAKGYEYLADVYLRAEAKNEGRV